MTLSLAFSLIADLALARGLQALNRFPGLWACRVDDKWHLKLNPHQEEIENVPPFNAMIFWGDLPAGLIDPTGGVIAAGSAANEDAFIAALRAAIAKETAQGKDGE